MALSKETIIENITLKASGRVEVQSRDYVYEDGKLLSKGQPVRTSVEPCELLRRPSDFDTKQLPVPEAARPIILRLWTEDIRRMHKAYVALLQSKEEEEALAEVKVNTPVDTSS